MDPHLDMPLDLDIFEPFAITDSPGEDDLVDRRVLRVRLELMGHWCQRFVVFGLAGLLADGAPQSL